MRIVMLMLIPLMLAACAGHPATSPDENRPINTYH